ncbi:HIT domain-containing protein, partial [Elstera sp.]|uniref:HIT domain-containing protein n=1 Tax=Elstera sp. TaxID=1916664 RepID=UPI0037C0F368
GATGEFSLDSRLAQDTVPVAALALCTVLLMKDARFPWLILVPGRAGAVEILDLSPGDQARLGAEITQCAEILRAVATPLKLNIGALGNIVRQLHVHIVARNEGDAAWPGPVWGSGAAAPYDDVALAALLADLRARFA